MNRDGRKFIAPGRRRRSRRPRRRLIRPSTRVLLAEQLLPRRTRRRRGMAE